MDEYGDPELRTFLPYRIEPGIICRYDFPAFVPDLKSQAFKYFQAFRSCFHIIFQLFYRFLDPAFFTKPIE